MFDSERPGVGGCLDENSAFKPSAAAGTVISEAWCGPGLAASARSALVRIRGAVPAALVDRMDDAPVYAPRFGRASGPLHFEIVFAAVTESHRLKIVYTGETGAGSSRMIRPLGRSFWGKVWTLAARASCATISAVSDSIECAIRSLPNPS